MAKVNVAYCPKCAWPMAPRDARCSSCGYEIPRMRTRPFQYTLRDFLVVSVVVAAAALWYRSYSSKVKPTDGVIATVMNSNSSVIILRDEIVVLLHDKSASAMADAFSSAGRQLSGDAPIDRLTLQGGILDAAAVRRICESRGITKLQLDSVTIPDTAWVGLRPLDESLKDLRLVNVPLSDDAAKQAAAIKCLKHIEAIDTPLSENARDYFRRLRPGRHH